MAPLKRTTVHPRLRGEHMGGAGNVWHGSGSSPPTRGTRSGAKRPPDPNRFIPAYAGNTQKEQAGAEVLGVHPRLRGEHGKNLLPCRLNRGSSPPTRGTHLRFGGA